MHLEAAVLMRATQAKRRPIGRSEEVLSAHMRKCSLASTLGVSGVNSDLGGSDSGSDVEDCSWDADHSSPSDNGASLRMLDCIAARLIM